MVFVITIVLLVEGIGTSALIPISGVGSMVRRATTTRKVTFGAAIYLRSRAASSFSCSYGNWLELTDFVKVGFLFHLCPLWVDLDSSHLGWLYSALGSRFIIVSLLLTCHSELLLSNNKYWEHTAKHVLLLDYGSASTGLYLPAAGGLILSDLSYGVKLVS